MPKRESEIRIPESVAVALYELMPAVPPVKRTWDYADAEEKAAVCVALQAALSAWGATVEKRPAGPDLYDYDSQRIVTRWEADHAE